MLILLPPSLITCSVLLFPFPLLFCRFQYHSSPLSIHSWYPYILSLFAGSLCVHVQHTYTSTLTPTRPISLSLRVSVRCFPFPLNISLSFIHNSCVMCVAAGFLRAVASSLRRILPLFNFRVRIITFSSIQQLSFLPAILSVVSFIGSVTTFERPYGRWIYLPGPLFPALIDVTA